MSKVRICTHATQDRRAHNLNDEIVYSKMLLDATVSQTRYRAARYNIGWGMGHVCAHERRVAAEAEDRPPPPFHYTS